MIYKGIRNGPFNGINPSSQSTQECVEMNKVNHNFVLVLHFPKTRDSFHQPLIGPIRNGVDIPARPL